MASHGRIRLCVLDKQSTGKDSFPLDTVPLFHSKLKGYISNGTPLRPKSRLAQRGCKVAVHATAWFYRQFREHTKRKAASNNPYRLFHPVSARQHIVGS